MNKARVNSWLIPAKEALEHKGYGVVSEGTIPASFRGYIAKFGAAVVMGSLPTAVAFFSEQGGAEKDRSKLLQQMWYVINHEDVDLREKKPKEIMEYVCKNDSNDLKEKFADASVAIKLAMNFFILSGDKKGKR